MAASKCSLSCSTLTQENKPTNKINDMMNRFRDIMFIFIKSRTTVNGQQISSNIQKIQYIYNKVYDCRLKKLWTKSVVRCPLSFDIKKGESPFLSFTFIERKFYYCCRDEFFSDFDEDFVTEFAVCLSDITHTDSFFHRRSHCT